MGRGARLQHGDRARRRLLVVLIVTTCVALVSTGPALFVAPVVSAMSAIVGLVAAVNVLFLAPRGRLRCVGGVLTAAAALETAAIVFLLLFLVPAHMDLEQGPTVVLSGTEARSLLRRA